MPEVTAERVRLIAAAARVPLSPASAERVASAIAPAVKRLSEANLALPLEVEPATFMVVQLGKTRR
ncbi:MAG: hypothetical protein WBX25_11975 [Rhodomicrobium sp.]